MKTVSIGIENLCVPCHSHCRYCLLSSCGKATGIDYDRGVRLVRRLREEMAVKRPDLQLFYYIGYCMETPYLWDYISFCRDIGSPSGKFLQMNGLAFRGPEETENLIRRVKEAGVESVDLTFYGMEPYHDRFAGRAGDFEFLLQLLSAANRVGLRADISLPLLRENLTQAEGLLKLLSAYDLGTVFVFLPHSKGRGQTLEAQRLTKSEFEGLSDCVKTHFSKIPCLTEGEWVRRGEWPEAAERTLTLSLTPENIDRLECMPLEDIVTYLEQLDDAYYAAVPPAGALAEQYGDPNGEKLFRARDLLLQWQQCYLREHPGIYDMNDERQHFSVRV